VFGVKDEAGDPLLRAPDLLEDRRQSGHLGGGGMTFFAELELGFLGTCPYTGLADVLQRCFNGTKRSQAGSLITFGRFLPSTRYRTPTNM
jgi:hypothetical protein